MFLVILKFSENKHLASQWMAAHNQWIKQGIDEKVFLLVAGIKPGLGGIILAHNCSQENLHFKINQDPFVQQKIVQTEIMEITPSKFDERLAFLIS